MFDTRRCLNFPQQRRVAGFTQLVEGGVVGASRVGLFSLFDLPLEFLFNILRKKKIREKRRGADYAAPLAF
jgi:hypothetical protein